MKGPMSTAHISEALKIPQDTIHNILKRQEVEKESLIKKMRESDKLPAKHIYDMLPFYEITSKGYEYIDRRDMRRTQERQGEFNKILALTSVVIALTSFLTFISSDFINIFYNSKNNSISSIGLLAALLFAGILIWIVSEIIGELTNLRNRS